MDNIFDPMPLDYFKKVKEINLVSTGFIKKYENLYKAINQSIGHFKWQEEDLFIKQNNKELQQWRSIAKELLINLNNV